MDALCLVYYCSGHGYGHATRVSAFARHLLSVAPPATLTVHIVSSAPPHVFADSIAKGALYRNADIDPVIVQPLAYRVDRQKSVAVLKSFLENKPTLLARECEWLRSIGANGVLSDAAFLGCLAAKTIGIPSILITNFSFDSVYSFFSTSLCDSDDPLGRSLSTLPGPSTNTDTEDDTPIPLSTLAPLVSQIHQGYQCADRLILLPGYIPMPSFFVSPPLPSHEWVDLTTGRLRHDVMNEMVNYMDGPPRLHEPVPFPSTSTSLGASGARSTPRTVVKAPLIVRPHTPAVYTPQGRAELLVSLGVPPGVNGELHDPRKTKILIVSFGGQVIRRPCPKSSASRPGSRGAVDSNWDLVPQRDDGANTGSPMRGGMEDPFAEPEARCSAKSPSASPGVSMASLEIPRTPGLPTPPSMSPSRPPRLELHAPVIRTPTRKPTASLDSSMSTMTPLPKDERGNLKRLSTPGHLWIPGAPAGGVSKRVHDGLEGVEKGYRDGGGGDGRPGFRLEDCELSTRPPSSPSSLRLKLGFDAPSSSGSETSSSSSSSSPKSIVTELTIPNLSMSDGGDGKSEQEMLDTVPSLLPPPSTRGGYKWIAIVCGVSKAQWDQGSETTGLPEGFYVAPKDVYMPDLTAVGDVLLGKLGYGTVSECVDACMPFVYVSRPLFVEEHGLRLLLETEGVGVELSRAAYEAGDWAGAVLEAFERGVERKEGKRVAEEERVRRTGCQGGYGEEGDKRQCEGRMLAKETLEWFKGHN